MTPRGPTASLWLFAVALGLALGSCRDESAERFERGRLRYQALLEAQTPARAKAFDEVLRDLEMVAPVSKHADAARKLAAAIRAARGERVRTPLALSFHEGQREPQLLAQLDACALLAKRAGLDGGIDAPTLQALDACRLRAEKLELRLSHGDEYPDVDAGH